MSDKSQIKTYKNRQRDIPEKTPKTYTPQYKVLGVEPTEYKSAVALDNTYTAVKKSQQLAEKQTYAQIVSSPIGRGKGPIPNVGNNMEHTWSSVDGEIMDDLGADPFHPMVDNNDYVSNPALGLSSQPELPMMNDTQEFTQSSDENELLNIIHDLEEGSYLLLVQGTPVCSGPKEEIEEQARTLVFENQSLDSENSILDDDIVVIKRVSIKIGLFLE